VGDSWDIGSGWVLNVTAVNASASPGRARLVLSKDGVKKDDKIAYQGTVYTYVEKSLGGESDTPLFVTYIDSVFAGATSDMVQLRYTWAVDTAVTEVKGGDKFGVMKVTEAGDDTIKAWNEDSSVSLSKDSTADIMGNMKFQVADSDTARFYPKVDYLITGEGVTATETPLPPGVTATPTKTPAVNVTVTPLVAGTPVGPEVTETAKPPAPTATPKEPGFETILAISGLLAVAYLVLRQRK
jgi:hypothetical protein